MDGFGRVALPLTFLVGVLIAGVLCLITSSITYPPVVQAAGPWSITEPGENLGDKIELEPVEKNGGVSFSNECHTSRSVFMLPEFHHQVIFRNSARFLPHDISWAAHEP